MRTQARTVAVVTCFLLLLASLPSFPYNIGDQALTARVDFSFVAGDRSLPAGTYRIAHHVSEFPAIEIGNVEGKTILPMLAITRLARRTEREDPNGSLVFDKVGDKYFLSEVWLPGLDGFLLRATKEKHEHVVVTLHA